MQGRLEEAQSLFEECVRLAAPVLGDTHPRVLSYTLNIARVRIARGDGAATEAPLRRVLAERLRHYPAGDPRIAQAQSLLGAALQAGGHYDEAERLMVAADAALRPIAGVEGREREANRARLSALYASTARPLQAAAYR